jgi:hypothetical protein
MGGSKPGKRTGRTQAKGNRDSNGAAAILFLRGAKKIGLYERGKTGWGAVRSYNPTKNKKTSRTSVPEAFTLKSPSATRLSWPFGFRPVALRHRLSTVLPFRGTSFFYRTIIYRNN